MRTCLYCGTQKPLEDFSDEHIWPNALGGDFLPKDVWRTNEVCQSCNNLAGLYVDGAFIRSWFGKAEISYGINEYLAGKGRPVAIPLNYMGPILNTPLPPDHVADFWAGPCGANIIHIRPDDEQWLTYAGGNPTARKAKAGRAYMALTSADPFWIDVSLQSFYRHFDRAERFVVNMTIPSTLPFKNPDRSSPVQGEDMETVDAFIEQVRAGTGVHCSIATPTDLGSRLLSKLGLSLGYQLLGPAFLDTEYAKNLRKAMREGNSQKRQQIPVLGTGFLNDSAGLDGLGQFMAWPGGWVLMVMLREGLLTLFVTAPSGRSMAVVITDDSALMAAIDPKYSDGIIWITVPPAAESVGPISLPDYIAHQTNASVLPALTILAAKRGNPATLPSCHAEASSSSIPDGVKSLEQ